MNDGLVLSIIDKIRLRKARPDQAKIVRHLMRTGLFTVEEDAVLALQDCVGRKIAMEVSYKGSISYRNAEKARVQALQRRTASKKGKNVKSPLCEAKTEEKSDHGADSFPCKDTQVSLTQCSAPLGGSEACVSPPIESILNHSKEESRPNHASNSVMENQDDVVNGDISPSPKTAQTSTDGILRERPPSKRMKFKKTHGPEFETTHLTKKQRSGKKEKEMKNPEAQQEFHISAATVHTDSSSSSDGASLKSRPVSGMASYPTPSSSSPSEEEESQSLPAKKIKMCFKDYIQMQFQTITTDVKFDKDNYPDPRGWSVEDVACFFRQAGFAQHAHIFTEKEIDGSALMLMQREDILTKLDLKLGPALKISEHIQKLQKFGQDLVCH